MVKKLSEKELVRRKITQKAVIDYFGGEIEESYMARLVNALVRSQIHRLMSGERIFAKVIQQNLKDKEYRDSLRNAL